MKKTKGAISLHSLLLCLVCILFAFMGESYAQQQIVYNQYLQNPYYVNPAFSGTDGITEFVLLAREQWIGYKDRPRTYSLNFQMNLLDNPVLGTPLETKSVRRGSSARTTNEIFRNASMGVAGTLINDVNGRVRRTGIQASYSYQILAGDWMLAAGLGMSFMQYKVNVLPTDLFDIRVDDPLITAGKPIKGYAPDFNIGFAVSNGRYWGGALRHLLATEFIAIRHIQREERLSPINPTLLSEWVQDRTAPWCNIRAFCHAYAQWAHTMDGRY